MPRFGIGWAPITTGMRVAHGWVDGRRMKLDADGTTQWIGIVADHAAQGEKVPQY